MIRTAFEKFWAWCRDTAGPGILDGYRNHEGVRHFFTLLIGVFLGAVFFG